MTTSSRTPTLTEAVTRAIDIRLAALFSSRVGVVKKYYPDTQMVDVQPQLKEVYEDDTGEPAIASLPVINNVPVYFPGGGDFFSTMPIAEGDELLLVFADRSLDVWKEKGGEVDPVALQRHALTDAIALVGVRSKPGKLTEVDTARAVFGKTGGVRIAIDDLVHLGVSHNEAAPNFVALANLVLDELNKLKTHFQALEAIISGPPINEVGNGAPSVFQQALSAVLVTSPYPNPTEPAAQKVKAK